MTQEEKIKSLFRWHDTRHRQAQIAMQACDAVVKELQSFAVKAAEKLGMKIRCPEWDPSHPECEENPTGRCLYDQTVAGDDCVFCGEPEER